MSLVGMKNSSVLTWDHSNITCGINPKAPQAVAQVSPGDQIWWSVRLQSIPFFSLLINMFDL
jgi:hypothetical protein